MSFKGKPPGSGAGEISTRTIALRPAILLDAAEVARARRMRRAGPDPDAIADALRKPIEAVEKALVQMRMPRPETTRGTLNVTLAAHRVVMAERRGDEPIWGTVDRLIDELLSLRGQKAGEKAPRSAAERGLRRRRVDAETAPVLPGLAI